ncbi:MULTISPECIES: hypothetical protein [unclassified Paenibacillus]|nr:MULTISPECIES: hypothetical protein [unclassified Paenibacillus]
MGGLVEGAINGAADSSLNKDIIALGGLIGGTAGSVTEQLISMVNWM